MMMVNTLSVMRRVMVTPSSSLIRPASLLCTTGGSYRHTQQLLNTRRQDRNFSSSQMMLGRSLLDRLADGGVVIGDGSFVFTLEKRGYVSVGSWTPEAAALYPEAVRQLHREYLRAGSDVMQTFTFYCSDDKIQFDKDLAQNANQSHRHNLTSAEINNSACDLAREVADEGDALVAGSLSPLPAYVEKKSKAYIQEEFRKQCEVYVEKGADFLLGEFYAHVEEAEWAIETMKEFNKPVACTMRICTVGDMDGVSPGDCAVRMAKAGADVVGVNCMYDPDISLKTLSLMKDGLKSAGLKTYLMAQPVGFHTQEIDSNPEGYIALPEFPFAMEPRLLTRIDVQNFARKAFELGVQYLGGCCGFEPYHIRAIAEELSQERGKRPPGAAMSPGVEGLKLSFYEEQRKKANVDYWNNLTPAAGRMNVKKVVTQ
ncbi:betaine--homocysteine S-methyltransferase 1-like [Amphiura filiformis]|uniref:betaine--homocysteine S-methyltransferase 1-like n=1 Tax=Amphiura filiformis TaxID=82378 RepID=UPI003B21B59E